VEDVAYFVLEEYALAGDVFQGDGSWFSILEIVRSQSRHQLLWGK
jgi:hypothetical protein